MESFAHRRMRIRRRPENVPHLDEASCHFSPIVVNLTSSPCSRALHGGGMGDQRARARPSAGADGFVGVAWTPRSVWFAGM